MHFSAKKIILRTANILTFVIVSYSLKVLDALFNDRLFYFHYKILGECCFMLSESNLSSSLKEDLPN